MSKILIEKADYAHIGEAVEKVFEIFPIDMKGKKVFIKPNLLRSSAPEECIVTHPAVLRAVVEKVKSMNPAAIVVGDNPGIFGYGENEEAFKETGLMDAAMGCYMNIGDDSQKVPFNPAFLPEVTLSRIVLDADVIISLPKFKTHGLTVLSGAIKNSYGFLPGAQKAKLHKAAGSPGRFHEVIVDVFRLRVPDLFIVDAVTGMEGNGPASPDVRDIGVILASDNAVALDGVIAVMMGCNPEDVFFLRKAKESGLGEYDLACHEILGELKTIPGFKLPPVRLEGVPYVGGTEDLFESRIRLRPKVDAQSCTGCGACIDHCAARALSMGDRIPVVDADTCITCFCCQEICPQRAITLQ